MVDLEIFKRLDKNTADTLVMVQQIDDAALCHPAAQGWSGIEILEHICLTDRLVSNFIFGPPHGVANKKILVGEEQLKQLLLGTGIAMEAPPLVRPSGAIQNRNQFVETFSKLRKNLQERLKIPEQPDDFRYYHTPLMGNLTVRDWLLFMVFHTERHLNQLRRVIDAQQL